MKYTIFIAVVFFTVVNCLAARPAPPSLWEQKILAIATPVSAKIVGNGFAKNTDMNQLYEVDLKNIEAIHGDVSEKNSSVILKATSKEAILKNKKIFILASKSDKRQIQSVLYWGALSLIACVPKEIIDGIPEGEDFSNYSARPDAKCINAEWFK